MFTHYLATALRHFTRHKTTTAINVLCLAFGFVCFALAFGMVRYTTTADSYHEKADRTYVLTQRSEFLGASTSIATQAQVGYGFATHLKNDFPGIEIAARAFPASRETPIAAGKDQRFVNVAYADPQFLDVVDLNFLLGDRRNALKAPRSAVITADLAMKLYGRTNVIGEPILVANRETVHITGVVGPQRQPSHISTDSSPGRFRFSLLVSVDVANYNVESSSAWTWIFNTSAITYLVLPESHAITPQHLREQLPAFFKRKFSDACCLAILGLRPLAEINAAGFDFLIKRDATGISQTAMLMMFGALVLGVACLNYANLASAHAITRLKEIALCRVVGAYRWQIGLQSCIESVLVSLCATAIALLALPFAVKFLEDRVGYDIGSTLFGEATFWLSIFAASVMVALIASTYPALIASRVQPARAMQGGRVPHSKRPIMHALVVVQFAAASLLFIATGIMYAQNERARRVLPSNAQDPLIVIDNVLRIARVDAKTLKDELRKLPQIKSISSSNMKPGSLARPMFVLRGGFEPTSRSWISSTPTIDYDFFTTLGIPFLAGRDFDPHIAADISTESKRNVIIDRALAEEYGWHNPHDAIGKAIYYPGSEEAPAGVPAMVIGVVENANLLPIVTVGNASTLYELDPSNSFSYFVRISKDDVAAGLAAIDSTWRKLSPNVPLKRSFVDEEYERLYRQVTSITLVFRIVAFLALFISTMGLVGIAAHVIAQRTFEIGVRRSFGASARQVFGMLLKDFSKPILIANMIAWPLAYIAAQAYSSFFADRAPITAAPFILSLVLGLTVAWLAVLRQATRAARMNPATVLRHE